jgi:isopentenyl-diphosphate delta-isomerase
MNVAKNVENVPNAPPSSQTVSRKRDHVELCVGERVAFRGKTAGFERVEFMHNALPEVDFADISTATTFLGKSLSMPQMISCMTGGYAEAERLNRELAEVCETLRIAMGVGSQRQALESTAHHATFRAARQAAPTIPLVGNIGAAEVAQASVRAKLRLLVDLIEADALTVHLNPLQELLQPEGTPTFRGVLAGIEDVVRTLGVPIIVKEVGAGISGAVAKRLLDVGVAVIDVAGAGGTSWAGVEILRAEQQPNHPSQASETLARTGQHEFWDWGLPTVECLRQIRPLKTLHTFTLVASGGVHSGIDAAKALALGADMAATARQMLQTLKEQGQIALETFLLSWKHQLQSVMFLTGSANIQQLQTTELLISSIY